MAVAAFGKRRQATRRIARPVKTSLNPLVPDSERRASPRHNTFDGGRTMTRATLVMAVALAAAGLIAARHEGNHDAVKVLTARDIVEKLDGKEAKATAVEVTLEPGEVEDAHRHPGPGFGYV